MKLRTGLLAAAATIAIAPAANAYEGLYGAIGAGLNYMLEDRDVKNETGPFLFDSDADFDNGVGAYGALGYAFGNDWRAELELSHRRNDVRHIAPQAGFSGIHDGDFDGDYKTSALLVNIIRDFPLPDSPVTAYLGGGFGVANIDADASGATGPLSISYGDTYQTYAYQGIAGLGFDIAEGLLFDLSYRFFGTGKKATEGLLNGAAADYKLGYHAHSVFAGLRWNFGAPGGAPATQYKDCWDGSSIPVSADCPAQLVEDASVGVDPIQFTVYFDYNKSNLTSEAATLIDEASGRALQHNVGSVVVQGNTDTSGSSSYNQRLSEKRGKVVRDALVTEGLDAGDITVEAYGENNLAKPTPDGTREPLNRRSDVTISFE